MTQAQTRNRIEPQGSSNRVTEDDRLWRDRHMLTGSMMQHSDGFDFHVIRTTIDFANRSSHPELVNRRLAFSFDEASLVISAYGEILGCAAAYTKETVRWRQSLQRLRQKLRESNRLVSLLRVKGEGSGDPVSLTQRFEELASRWREETELLSSTEAIVRHPAYQQIIGLGKPALPLILADLAKTSDLWFHALFAITGENPIPPEIRGNVRKMAEIWLAWGERHGYSVR
jgi:hypothetical protein